jgi:23S rRNA (adenine-N6)-dimethyltransferase
MPTPWHTQNFLRHPTRIERLLDLTSISADDLVLDLGAGHGELTVPLAKRCRMVVAVEKDPLLAASLQRRFAEQRKVLVREADALAVRLPRQPYKVVANIPFDITARLVRRLMSATYPPQDSYLVVQREAATRVLGVPRQTLFANLLRPWFEPSVVHRFQRTDFAPPPRVDVVFLRLRKRGPPLVDDARSYAQLLTGCFGAPHMQAVLAPLIGRRCSGRIARELGFDRRAPASTLCFEQWLELWRRLRNDYPGGSKVTTSWPILRPAGRTIKRPARRPPSRRQA